MVRLNEASEWVFIARLQRGLTFNSVKKVYII